MAEYLQIVGDELELFKFFNLVMPDLSEGEGWFIALSSRSKKMTDEERKLYKMTHKEMFARKILFDDYWELFKNTLYGYHRDKRSFGDLFLEPRALVCYMLINPVTTGKALKNFKQKLTEYEYKKQYEGVSEVFKPFRVLENSFHISRGTKHFVDIDIDWGDGISIYPIDTIIIELLKFGLGKDSPDYHLIQTGSGGIHILLRIEALREKTVNAQKIVEALTESFKESAKEVKINTDAMIPIPGTIQYGRVVKLL